MSVFIGFLQHFKTVLEYADAKIGVLNTPFDGSIYEKNIDRISESYITGYSETRLSTTIQERLAANFYDSIYRLYHDLKIASMSKLLNETKLGSDMYLEIDHFYKFAVEMLLQESYRLHLKINEHYSATITKEANKGQEQEREQEQEPNVPSVELQAQDKISDADIETGSTENISEDGSQKDANQKAIDGELETNKKSTDMESTVQYADSKPVKKNKDDEVSITKEVEISDRAKNEELKADVEMTEALDSPDNLSSLAKSLSEDYDTILTSFKCKNNFALLIPNASDESTSAPLSLFSSLVNKSELDMNEYNIPAPFSSLTILPQTTTTPATNLKFISNTNPLNNSSITGNNKISNATGVPPMEIMRPIFHPNWFSLPSIPWLDFKSSSTFIPLIDETLSVISVKNKNKIYYEQIGLKKLQKVALNFKQLEQESNGNQKSKLENEVMLKENEKDEETETNGEAEQIAATPPKDEKEASADSEKPENKSSDLAKAEDISESDGLIEATGKVSLTEKPGSLPVNVQNILEWKNGNAFEDDELKAFNEGKEQQLLSKILIDLNKLRSKRHTSTSKVMKPCVKEQKLYYKSKRILEIMVHRVKPSDLVDNSIEEVDTAANFQNAVFEDKGIRLSHSIPVLATNYMGTLPIPYAASNNNLGRNRIGTSSRSHKKRR